MRLQTIKVGGRRIKAIHTDELLKRWETERIHPRQRGDK
jgi:hypothetical protein